MYFTYHLLLWYISSCVFHKPVLPLTLRFTSINSNCVFSVNHIPDIYRHCIFHHTSFECQDSVSLNSINADFKNMHCTVLIQMYILMVILSLVKKWSTFRSNGQEITAIMFLPQSKASLVWDHKHDLQCLFYSWMLVGNTEKTASLSIRHLVSYFTFIQLTTAATRKLLP